MAATDTHNDKDHIDTAVAATADGRNNDKLGVGAQEVVMAVEAKGLFICLRSIGSLNTEP